MVPLAKFLQKLQGWEEKEFLEKYTLPFLVTSRKHIQRIPHLEKAAFRPQGGQFSTMISSIQSDRMEKEWLQTPWICQVRKKEGGGEMQWVNLGRTHNNDIVIPLPVISKFHCCFFIYGPKEAYLVEGGSTNGTFLNEVPLEANQKVALQDGDGIRFGTQIEFEFFFPQTFWNLLSEYSRLLRQLPF